MKSLHAGKGFYVNADSVEIVQEWGSRVSEREKKKAVERGQFYDACRGKAIRCLITLKSGFVIACAIAPATLVSRPLVHPPIKTSVRRARAEEETQAVRDLLEDSPGDYKAEEAEVETAPRRCRRQV